MTARYRLDPAQSRFTVQAFAAGMLSFLGHSPTFAVRDFTGVLTVAESQVSTLALAMAINADGLELLDKVRDADRREIEGTMRRDVLQTAAYPEIRYESTDVSAEPVERGRYQLHVGGRLSLHGVTRPHAVSAEWLVFVDGMVLHGESALRLSDYGIKPVTALGGTIRLKDGLRLTFHITAVPEGQ